MLKRLSSWLKRHFGNPPEETPDSLRALSEQIDERLKRGAAVESPRRSQTCPNGESR